MCPEWLQRWVLSEVQNPSWTTGVFEYPDFLPKPAQQGNVICRDARGSVVDIASVRFDQRHVVTDGSAVTHFISEMSRAGWAALWCDCDLNVVFSVAGPVWAPLPQTAQAGEHVGFAVGYELAEAPFIGHSDCLNVVHAANKPADEQLLSRATYAGIRRSALANYSARHFTEARYVPAHRSDAAIAALCDRDRKIALANQQADLLAKAARREGHSPMTEAKEKELEALSRRQKLVLLTIARTLAAFPREPRHSRKARLSAEEREQRKQHRLLVRAKLRAARAARQYGHAWRFDRARRAWQCCRCLASAPDDGGIHDLPPFGCHPSAPLEQMRQESHGHNIHTASILRSRELGSVLPLDSGVLVFCRTCGLYSEQRLRDLRGACAGHAEKQSRGDQNLKRILQQQLHPVRKDCHLEHIQPLMELGIFWEAADDSGRGNHGRASSGERRRAGSQPAAEMGPEHDCTVTQASQVPSPDLVFADTPASFVPSSSSSVELPTCSQAEQAAQDLLQMEQIGMAVSWPRSAPLRRLRAKTPDPSQSLHFAATPASFVPGSSSGSSSRADPGQTQALHDLAELDSFGFAVRWPRMPFP